MSFLTRTINISRTAAIATPVSRIAAVRTSRTFTTSLAAQRTATDAVKDELKHIDRVVSDKLVDGINIASMSYLSIIIIIIVISTLVELHPMVP